MFVKTAFVFLALWLVVVLGHGIARAYQEK